MYTDSVALNRLLGISYTSDRATNDCGTRVELITIYAGEEILFGIKPSNVTELHPDAYAFSRVALATDQLDLTQPDKRTALFHAIDAAYQRAVKDWKTNVAPKLP